MSAPAPGSCGAPALIHVSSAAGPDAQMDTNAGSSSSARRVDRRLAEFKMNHVHALEAIRHI